MSSSEVPTIRALVSSPAWVSRSSPGSSLRLARSPVAPKSTMTCGSGHSVDGRAHELPRYDAESSGDSALSSRSAFQRDSAYSSSTSDWTVIPPPVPSRYAASPVVVSVRMTTPRSARPSAEIQPNAPAYAPRGVASTPR